MKRGRALRTSWEAVHKLLLVNNDNFALYIVCCHAIESERRPLFIKPSIESPSGAGRA